MYHWNNMNGNTRGNDQGEPREICRVSTHFPLRNSSLNRKLKAEVSITKAVLVANKTPTTHTTATLVSIATIVGIAAKAGHTCSILTSQKDKVNRKLIYALLHGTIYTRVRHGKIKKLVHGSPGTNYQTRLLSR